MKKHFLVVGIMFLFVFSSVPVTFGYNGRTSNVEPIVKSVNFDSYHISEKTRNTPYTSLDDISNTDIVESNQIDTQKETLEPLEGPMDSDWPMCSHDVRHTGSSPYITANTTGIEKWHHPLSQVATGGIAIDNDGTIYIGSDGLYAFHQDGTKKWEYSTNYKIVVVPAISEEGVIYFGTVYGNPYLFAVNTTNGTLKWKLFVGESIFSSPAIGEDGTIYFGDANNNINSLNSNGTLKWRYTTGHSVYSSPAIGDDGTIYCGSHDTYLYALYPNGTLKWRYKTGNWVRVSPCIGDDGTIYVVSLDNYLHAVYPNNGTRKWRTNVGAGTSPTIGQDGTIYAGYRKLHAVNSIDGSIKWTFDPGPDRMIRAATPCNSIDGTIYFGTHIGETDGGELIAVNPDGTEKWRIMVATNWVDSAPAIDNDGTIYVGSWNNKPPSKHWGYLHAIGPLDTDAPSAPDINGPASGNYGVDYEYSFRSTSPLGRDVYYYIEWGDGKIKDWFGPFASGEEVNASHKWFQEGTYMIRARAKDTDNLWGPWGEFEVYMPRDKAVTNSLLFRLLERFPLLQKIFIFLPI